MSAHADIAYITPGVLKWALENSGISREVVANKAKTTVEQLDQWATDPKSPPPFKKAQQVASILRIPFGFLFLQKPPKLESPLPDLRANPKGYQPTAEFTQLLNDVLVKQEWFREYVSESRNKPQLKFVGAFDVSDRIADVAADIRSSLGMGASLRSSVASWSEYLNTLVRRSEDVGVLVMRSSVVGHSTKQRVKIQELQGFAIADDRAPLVFLNSADYKAAQIFTFAHEIAHIWIGKSAIANVDPLEIPTNKIERFCNEVAAATLVPQNEFLSAWDAERPDRRLYNLPRRFWVSSLVILRRALENDRISITEFKNLREEELSKVQGGDKPKGGDFYRNLVVRMGSKFTATVISEVNRERIELKQAAKLLGVSGRTLVKYAEMAR